jgi:UDPglucose--hexose-1-phosphate uridylyltransferase
MRNKFKFLKNPVSGKWVILSPSRAKRPTVAKGTEPVCPFCLGHEELTPPEVGRTGGGEKNKPGWLIRVVPNKYPFAPVHEVIVDSPDHHKNLFELDTNYAAKVFRVYRDRYNQLKDDAQVVIFYNYGVEAAASLPHPHAQLAVIPKKVRMDVTRSVTPENLIHESKYFTLFIPQATAWPYEVWFLPKKRGRLFGDVTNNELDDLGKLLTKIYQKLQKILGEDFPFNFHIYHGGDWYLRFIPRSRVLGGFELATGVYVHSTNPKDAAKELSW